MDSDCLFPLWLSWSGSYLPMPRLTATVLAQISDSILFSVCGSIQYFLWQPWCYLISFCDITQFHASTLSVNFPPPPPPPFIYYIDSLLFRLISLKVLDFSVLTCLLSFLSHEPSSCQLWSSQHELLTGPWRCILLCYFCDCTNSKMPFLPILPVPVLLLLSSFHL